MYIYAAWNDVNTGAKDCWVGLGDLTSIIFRNVVH